MFRASLARTAALGACLLLLAAGRLDAEITVASLPGAMADFALNPETGDVAAVDPIVGRAYLFRRQKLAAGAGDFAADVEVGETPVAVAYKRYGDKRYFGVVCSQDPHLWLLDADKLTLVGKTLLAGDGASAIVSSSSPRDPFFYYSYGSGHDSAAGAFDVRAMADRGPVLDRVKDCALSADGRIVYRRGPWHPSGLESLRMTTDLSADKPQFERLFYDHVSTAAYLPGPFGEYTVAGEVVFTATLKKRVASLGFGPGCIFRSRPLIVGFSRIERRGRAADTLEAASYNTLTSTGRKVALPAVLVGDAAGQGELKRIGMQRRLLADDLHGEVIVAYMDQLGLVPVEEFAAKQEPLMRVTASADRVVVGRKQQIRLQVSDPRVELSLAGLPEGAAFADGRLSWQPTEQQIGEHAVEASLSFGETRRVVRLPLSVSRPFLKLPFVADGLQLDPPGNSAVIRSVADAPAQLGVRQQQSSQLAVVPLDGKRPTVKTLDFAIRAMVVAAGHVAVLPANDPRRVEIYRLDGLDPVKTLRVPSAAVRLDVDSDRLLVGMAGGTQVYDLKDFRQLEQRSDRSRPTAWPPLRGLPRDGVLRDGVLRDGVLYDFDGKTRLLVVEAGPFPSVGRPRLDGARFLRRVKTPATRARAGLPAAGLRTAALATQLLASAQLQVQLEHSLEPIPSGNEGGARRLEQKIALRVFDLDGTPVRRVPFVQQEAGYAAGRRVLQPRLALADEKVVVLLGDSLYQWSAAAEDAQRQRPADGDVAAAELHLAPKQTAVFVDAEGKTTLRHEARGGEGPYEYYLADDPDAVTLGLKSGDATVDGARLRQQAAEVLVEIGHARGDAHLRALSLRLAEPAERRLGRRPNGIPVALPLRIKAVDRRGEVAELAYFVFTEVPYQEVADAVEKRRQQAPPQPAPPADNAAQLAKRIARLEAQVEQLTRRLSQLQKSLDKEK